MLSSARLKMRQREKSFLHSKKLKSENIDSREVHRSELLQYITYLEALLAEC